MTKTRMFTKLLVVLAIAGSGLFLTATPTSGQTPCDPEIYPCPPETPTEFTLDLTLNLAVGTQGLGVRAQVCGFAAANVPFQVVFRDILIIQGISGDGATPAQRCSASQSFSNQSAAGSSSAGSSEVAGAAVLLVAAQQQAGFPLTFKVPELPLALYQVCASAPGHNSDCEQFTIIGASGTGGTGLARTGITVALLLAVALALIVIGRAVIESSRRRRAGIESEIDDREPANQR